MQGYRVITMRNKIGKLLVNMTARKYPIGFRADVYYHPPLKDIILSERAGLKKKQYLPMIYTRALTLAPRHAVATDFEDAYNRVPLGFLMTQLLDSIVLSS